FRLDTNTIFAVGDNGNIVKSTNGGSNWALLASPGGSLVDQWWKDAQTGYVIGPLLIRRTTNGGQSWASIPNVTDNSATFPGDIQFLDAQNGWIFTDFDTFRTTNGGTNWFKLPFPIGQFPIYQEEAVVFDATTRLVATEAEGADIWKTTDDGSHWLRVFEHNGTRGVTDLHRLPNGAIVGVTSDGDLLRSTDSGATWTNFTEIAGPQSRANFNVLDVAASGLGFAAGWQSLWVQTTDAGRTWFDPAATPGLFDVFAIFIRDSAFILAGGTGTTGQSDVRRSTNGGATWTTHPLSGSYVGYPQGLVAFADGTCFCATYGGQNVNFVYRSTDSGTTWHLRSNGISASQRIFDLFFLDSQNGFVCGGNFGSVLLQRTTDGGGTWTPVAKNGLTVGEIQDMHWFNAASGIVIGGLIQRTTNGGTNWQTVSPIGDDSIDFFDPLRGVADQFQTGVRTTTDGGTTWTPVPIPLGGFYADVAATPNGFLVVGGSNSILGYDEEDSPVAVSESIAPQNSFLVWPNPLRLGGNASLFFRLPDEQEGAAPVEARLYDARGRLLQRTPIAPREERISLEAGAHQPGVMFVELRWADGRSSAQKITFVP
ncbi:MAG TPA: YCF48-related protein, partial [bacterium]|nr:YCF48-related protein [bacterium]